MTTTTGWTALWILFYKSFGKITTTVFIRSVRVLYVVYSPTKVVLVLIELLIDSLTVSPFFAAKKFYEELDIKNVEIWNLWRWKHFAKNLEMTTTTGWTARWILFYNSFGKITTTVFIRSVRVLYVVYSPTKVVLVLIELLIDSLTVSPFFAAKKFYEELDINNVCVLIYIFRSAKSQH